MPLREKKIDKKAREEYKELTYVNKKAKMIIYILKVLAKKWT